MKTEVKMTRRRFLKIGGSFLLGAMAAPFAGFGYARFLEPRFVRTKQVVLFFPRLPQAFSGMRLVQFSDIHLDFHFGMGRMESLIEKLNKLKPDMLCFTGDLYDRAVGAGGEICAGLLARLEAPLGKWAVLGNHDYETGEDEVQQVLEKGGFSVLTNRSAAVDRGGAMIRVAGVDDVLKGTPHLQEALRAAGTDETFTVLLAHEPDFADSAARFPIDLQLSGHSHGGQVRLPFHGSLFTPQYAVKYPDGLYVLRDGNFRLYTNRGIGFSTVPVRFWCPPEITVFTLKSG